MKRKPIILVLVTVMLLFFILYTSSSRASPDSSLRVAFINVGQGDSALIQNNSGFDVLIDGGKPAAGPTVVAYLKQQNVDDVDVMLASHADSDHVGGLINVLNDTSITVRQVLYSGYPGIHPPGIPLLQPLPMKVFR